MSSVGARTRASVAASTRSGRPPREITALTFWPSCAAATMAAALPVLAPKYPIGSSCSSFCVSIQRVASNSLPASSEMLNRCSRERRSVTSSAAVRRSKSSVAMPVWCNWRATNRLRGLYRLLPLPCANSTIPRGSEETERFPDSFAGPAGMATSCSINRAVCRFTCASTYGGDKWRAQKKSATVRQPLSCNRYNAGQPRGRYGNRREPAHGLLSEINAWLTGVEGTWIAFDNDYLPGARDASKEKTRHRIANDAPHRETRPKNQTHPHTARASARKRK